MTIQDWIEQNDWSRIMEYVKEGPLQGNQFIKVFVQNNANITLDRVQQFVKCCLSINRIDFADFFTDYSDFFQNAIELKRLDVVNYIIQLEDTVDHRMIQYLIMAGARYARLVPNDQIEQFLREEDEEPIEWFIELFDKNTDDLSGLLYAVYVCSDVYLKSIYMNQYNTLIQKQK